MNAVAEYRKFCQHIAAPSNWRNAHLDMYAMRIAVLCYCDLNVHATAPPFQTSLLRNKGVEVLSSTFLDYFTRAVSSLDRKGPQALWKQSIFGYGPLPDLYKDMPNNQFVAKNFGTYGKRVVLQHSSIRLLVSSVPVESSYAAALIAINSEKVT